MAEPPNINDDDSSGLSTAALIGIIAGSIFGILLLILYRRRQANQKIGMVDEIDENFDEVDDFDEDENNRKNSTAISQHYTRFISEAQMMKSANKKNNKGKSNNKNNTSNSNNNKLRTESEILIPAGSVEVGEDGFQEVHDVNQPGRERVNTKFLAEEMMQQSKRTTDQKRKQQQQRSKRQNNVDNNDDGDDDGDQEMKEEVAQNQTRPRAEVVTSRNENIGSKKKFGKTLDEMLPKRNPAAKTAVKTKAPATRDDEDNDNVYDQYAGENNDDDDDGQPRRKRAITLSRIWMERYQGFCLFLPRKL